MLGQGVVDHWLPCGLDGEADMSKPIVVERLAKLQDVIDRALRPLIPQPEVVGRDAILIAQALEPREAAHAGDVDELQRRGEVRGVEGRDAHHDAVARQYVSWWQTRNLRMAANIVEAAGNQPGAKMLVIVGASHKAYFDAYLDQMQDWELVSVDAVLAD